jgi:hypothetical protein
VCIKGAWKICAHLTEYSEIQEIIMKVCVNRKLSYGENFRELYLHPLRQETCREILSTLRVNFVIEKEGIKVSTSHMERREYYSLTRCTDATDTVRISLSLGKCSLKNLVHVNN